MPCEEFLKSYRATPGLCRRALEAELYFYARVFHVASGDPVEPVPIVFEERL